MSINVTTSVDEALVRIIDRIAKEEGLDRAMVIRRFLHRAVREWLIEKSLKDYEAGKLTLWQAAKQCMLSLWEMIHEVKKRSIHVPYTLEDLKEDLKGLE
jgi:predicted HTH domain antitoxin